MFNNAVLDFAIGMIFVFLAASLAASAITEGIAGLFALRSKFLFRSIKDLLNDKTSMVGQAKFIGTPSSIRATTDWENRTEAACSFPSGWDYLEVLGGWLITAAGTMFGVPFWFDLLQRVIRLKAAGPSPGEKAKDDAAAAYAPQGILIGGL